MAKGISELATAALYVGITITAISTALTVGVPAVDNMRDAAAIRNAENLMHELDSNIDQVVSEGMGSTRTITLDIDQGRVYFENDSNSLVYEIETGANVISPQSSRKTGNVILSSNANVSIYNVTSGGPDAPAGYSGPDCYMMENEHIKACIEEVGNDSDFKDINTTDLLTYYEFRDSSKTLDGNITVKLDGLTNSSWGTGYTAVNRYGEFIGTGQVKAHVASEYGYTYDVIFALPTGADFLKIDVKNFS